MSVGEFFADNEYSMWNWSLKEGADKFGLNPIYRSCSQIFLGERSNASTSFWPATSIGYPETAKPEPIAVIYENSSYPSTAIHKSAGFGNPARFTDSGAFDTPISVNIHPNDLRDFTRFYTSNAHGLVVRSGANVGKGVVLYGTTRSSYAGTVLVSSDASAMDATSFQANTNLNTGAFARLNPGGTTDIQKFDNTGHYGRRGSGLSGIGGAIRRGELQNGINHPLALVMSGWLLSQEIPYRWPAWTMDSSADFGYFGNAADAVWTALSSSDRELAKYWGDNPYFCNGTRLAIPFYVDINKIRTVDGVALTPEALKVAEAAQNYGVYIVDQTPGITSSYIVAMDEYVSFDEIGYTCDSGSPAAPHSTYGLGAHRKEFDGERFNAGIVAILKCLQIVENNYQLHGHTADPYDPTNSWSYSSYFAPANNTWRKYKYFAPGASSKSWASVSGTAARVNKNTFTIVGNLVSTFTGKIARLTTTSPNSYSTYNPVVSATYSAGSGLTTVVLTYDGIEVPNTITAVAVAA